MRCLAKDAEQRWDSARDLKHELEWIAENANTAISAARRARNPWRERAVWIGTAVALVTLSFFVTMRGRTSSAGDVARFAIYPPESWSHDGKHVIFSVSARASGYDLWLLPLARDRKPVSFLRSPGAMQPTLRATVALSPTPPTNPADLKSTSRPSRCPTGSGKSPSPVATSRDGGST
jgi:hypothetical protein